MKLLLDTCVFFWIITDDSNLSEKCRELFIEPHNQIYLSVVSQWEIIVKHKLGRLPIPELAQQFITNQCIKHFIEELPLTGDAVWHLDRLPDYHKDPFDRMLICQAISEGMILVTPDKLITQYPIKTIW